MAITDIDISETLEAGAPSIKYTGDMNPNMQMASASDAQQKEAERLWQLELKKMELDEDYIPEIVDPEEMKVSSSDMGDPMDNANEHSMRMFNKPYNELTPIEIEIFEEEMLRLQSKFMASGGRVNFGLGSIFKSVGKAAKKLVKSPLGKAALLGLGGYGLGGGFTGGFSWGNLGSNLGLGSMKFAPAGGGQAFVPGSFLKGISNIIPSSGMGKAALLGGIGLTAAAAFEGMEQDDVKALRNNPEALRAHLTQYYSNINQLEPDSEEVKTWVESQMYSTGGRVGFASGANEKFEEKIAALVAKGLTRELAETIVLSDISPDNFQIIDALENKAQGGRIGYKEAGEVRMASASDPMDDKNQLSLRLFGKPLNSLTEDELIDLDEWMEDKAQKWQGAQGGRIGFAYGPDQTAEAAGIMGQLPVRNNAAGVKELDLRDSGGFIPPVGVKEKADDIPAMLSNNEFVMTADAVRAAGGGSVEKGAQVMYDQMKNLESKVA
jgi:hypothetical protein